MQMPLMALGRRQFENPDWAVGIDSDIAGVDDLCAIDRPDRPGGHFSDGRVPFEYLPSIRGEQWGGVISPSYCEGKGEGCLDGGGR